MGNIISINKKKNRKKIETVLTNMQTIDWLGLYQKDGKFSITKVLEYIIELLNKGE